MDGDVLAKQLGELGRQLDEATEELARLDVIATDAAIKAADAKEIYEDHLAEAFLALSGSVEVRKAEARTCTGSYRLDVRASSAAWERAKADVRNQQCMIRALTARIEIGRSLLSREKALAVLS